MTNKLIESLAQIQIPDQQPAPETCPVCGKAFDECEYFQSLDEDEEPDSQASADQ